MHRLIRIGSKRLQHKEEIPHWALRESWYMEAPFPIEKDHNKRDAMAATNTFSPAAAVQQSLKKGW